ncbi:unnamed protein product [Calicophoron daubneyi]|uniref:EF-hand domain-containing protein n=1 Tax=Calicophoron daubneyi TaxID=300641 RepID=A0AAV2TTH8_CALDB
MNEEDVKSLFKELDLDGDGKITLREVRYYLAKNEGVFNVKEARKRLHEYDKDGDGKVTLDELRSILVKK